MESERFTGLINFACIGVLTIVVPLCWTGHGTWIWGISGK